MALFVYAFALGVFVLVIWPKRCPNSSLTKLPVLRGSGLFGRTRTSLEYFFKGQALFQEGYSKYKKTGFQLFPRGRQEIFLTDPKLLDEVATAPEMSLSAGTYFNEMLQGSYTVPGHFDTFPFPKDFAKPSPYAANMQTLVRRRLGGDEMFSELWDEIKLGYKEEGPVNTDWAPIIISDLSRVIIARTSNRVFVGAPLCREKVFLNCVVDFATSVIMTAQILKRFPEFLKPYIAKVLRNTETKYNQAGAFLLPLIEEYQSAKKAGVAEPKTLLHWLLDAGKENDTEYFRDRIVRQVVILNFGSIHTTSMHLTKCIIELASRLEYQDSLRQEIINTVEEEGGWSNAALEKMIKLDSFLKEVQRVNPQGYASLHRIAVRPYTLSDGTYVPEGAIVGAPVGPMLVDEDLYPNADNFDGFRFSKLREQGHTKEEVAFASTSPTFCVFGDGKHACPGRFFASQEIRLMLAYLVLNYEVKLESGKRPKNIQFGAANFPDPKGKISIRARVG